MKLGSGSEFIELTELERTPKRVPCAGDIRVEVSIRLQDFNGRYSGVWLEFAEMARFISQLEDLEKTRRGSARISGMSPKEFSFEIRSSDKLGHMEVEVSLQRYQYSGRKYWPVSISGGFEVEPESIGLLISCFNEFTKERIT